MRIWKRNEVLNYYINLPDKELEIKYLVNKLVMLFFIAGTCRKEALFTINNDIIFADNKVIL